MNVTEKCKVEKINRIL